MKKIFFLIIPFLLILLPLFGEETFTLTVINNLDDAIYYLYLAPDGAPDWGEDRLGDDILDPGQSISLDLEAGETVYNLMVEDELEKTYRIDKIQISESRDIDVKSSDFLPFGGRNPVSRTLSFHNETDEDIYYLYVSSNSSMYWGEDILGDEILYRGEIFTSELPIDSDFPRHDILAEGESGSSYEILDIDLISTDDMTITSDDMTSEGEDYEDYSDDYEDSDDSYLEGYREGYRDGWKDAYRQGFLDAQSSMTE